MRKSKREQRLGPGVDIIYIHIRPWPARSDRALICVVLVRLQIRESGDWANLAQMGTSLGTWSQLIPAVNAQILDTSAFVKSERITKKYPQIIVQFLIRFFFYNLTAGRPNNIYLLT